MPWRLTPEVCAKTGSPDDRGKSLSPRQQVRRSDYAKNELESLA